MDSAIMAANEKQHFIIMDEDEYEEYWMQRKVEHDRISSLNGAREEGEEIGRQEGEEKKALEIARKMKAAGRPCSEIEEFTGLDIETINGLQ